MNQPTFLKDFKPIRLLLPVFIGLGVATWLFLRNFDAEALSAVSINKTAILGLLGAILMMFVRDGAYMYRIKLLTNHEISWKQSFNIILLWEFASAVTPSIVGGTAFALFLLMREGISAGRSTNIVLLTAFLDELFFMLFAPLVLIFVGNSKIFGSATLVNEAISTSMNNGLVGVFWTGYFILLIYTLLLAYGLFINPKGLQLLIARLFSLPLLRKWRFKALRAASDIMAASKELQSKDRKFWIAAFGSTAFSWTARYLVINFLIITFPNTSFSNSFGEHLVIYARQVVMWIIMLITPTPGGSGVAEFVFDNFLKEFLPNGLGGAMALIWRLISYYPYIFIGAILLPRWLLKKQIHEKG